MKVHILPAALRDLEELDAYVSEIFGSVAATETISSLFKTFHLLADSPHMGRPRPDVTRKPVHFFLKKPYWIVYQPGTALLIHRVYHAARDLDLIDKK
jgi:plasmid stabilization system protein ParE